MISETERFKFNNMNIHLVTANKIDSVSLIVMPIGSSSDLSSADIYSLQPGNRIQITNIKQEQVWWILYKVSAYREGSIQLNAWTSYGDWPQWKID